MSQKTLIFSSDLAVLKGICHAVFEALLGGACQEGVESYAGEWQGDPLGETSLVSLVSKEDDIWR